MKECRVCSNPDCEPGFEVVNDETGEKRYVCRQCVEAMVGAIDAAANTEENGNPYEHNHFVDGEAQDISAAVEEFFSK